MRRKADVRKQRILHQQALLAAAECLGELPDDMSVAAQRHRLRLALRPNAGLCQGTGWKGEPCCATPLVGSTRCRYHGGQSVGHSAEGSERIRQGQLRRWAKWRAERGL